jgi:antitoxin YefM
MANSELQYISDENGNAVGVIVPISLWREIESERETAYLLKSDAMRQRLIDAKSRDGGVTFEEARERLGV